MRVFVAGATGVIGRPLCRQLVAAGHEVTALTRTEANAERLRAAGVDVVYREYPGQIHAFVSLTKAIPQGLACTMEIGDYLRARLAGGC